MTQRNSADDRKGAANTSPFRSKADQARYLAATKMIGKRYAEIATLEQALASTDNKAEQKRLRLRLQASRNNLRSWEDYIAKEAPREPRAVITPAA